MSSRDPDREKIRESPVLSPRVLQAYRSPLKSFSSPPSSAKSGKSDDTDPERQPKSPSRLRSLYDPHSAEDPNNEDPWAHAMRLFTESSGGWIQAIRRGQKKLHSFLEDPSSSVTSLVANVFLALTIVFASVTNALETMNELYEPNKQMWYIMDTVVTAIFTLELVLRLIARSCSWKTFYTYLFSFYFIVDVMAIMPFYLELFHVDSEFMSYGRLAGLRSVRVFRLFKAFRFLNQIMYIQVSFEVAGEAVRRSLGPLFPLFFAGSVVSITLATLIYYVERGTFSDDCSCWMNIKGEKSRFTSIPATMWFVIVTLTTVGYGDVFPVTFFGRFFSLFAMICGMLLIALPSIIIGRHFSILWSGLKKKNAIPPMPDWLNRVLGGRSKKYQKLGPSEENIAGAAASAGKEKEKSMDGEILKSFSSVEEMALKPIGPARTQACCPKCGHSFKEGSPDTTAQQTIPSKSRENLQSNSVPVTGVPESPTWPFNDSEAIRFLLIEMHKANVMLHQLVEQNDESDELPNPQEDNNDD